MMLMVSDVLWLQVKKIGAGDMIRWLMLLVLTLVRWMLVD